MITNNNQNGEVVWYENTGTNTLGNRKVIHTGDFPRIEQILLSEGSNQIIHHLASRLYFVHIKSDKQLVEKN
ncbi:hypothetical protein [Mesonia sp. K4-1]|uniref:hypothetical protein n=1 Tax=Mesonia sp. K4-1 TaxID=2602760 RepID=UPI0011C74815|nr:hypothetical protein [Mesonia sp. K4-1]TXK73082.1 hypothetical protein FT986_13865 [Mesonia sp. K4-1]